MSDARRLVDLFNSFPSEFQRRISELFIKDRHRPYVIDAFRLEVSQSSELLLRVSGEGCDFLTLGLFSEHGHLFNSWGLSRYNGYPDQITETLKEIQDLVSGLSELERVLYGLKP